MKISELSALEILDSRGRPTLEVSCMFAGGHEGYAQVPSGASTGRAEAYELRDNDPKRYRGLGCLNAVAHVKGEFRNQLVGESFSDQATLDQRLLDIDGTHNKSRLGANAILGISLAFARASAAAHKQALYEYFATLNGQSISTLPRLTVNLFSGGKHAGGQVALQDVLVVPGGAASIHRSLQDVVAVYNTAADQMFEDYEMRKLTADEGGLAPAFPNIDAMFKGAIRAINVAGLSGDVQLALDVAASHFYSDAGYILNGKDSINATEMIETIDAWAHQYPIVSIEDGLAEDDWSHWPQLTATLGEHCLTLGDDLLCTNPERIQKAIDTKACNALLLKVNQIGTLTEALQALKLARRAGWHVTISARSGETEDNWLADLAVGWGADQIKVGSINQSERLAKYNRLLAIERDLERGVVSWPA